FATPARPMPITTRNAGAINADWTLTGGTVTITSQVGTINFGSLSGASDIVHQGTGTSGQSGLRIRIGDRGVDTTYSGSITGGTGLNKSGAGSLTLSGQNGFVIDAVTSSINLLLPVIVSQ